MSQCKPTADEDFKAEKEHAQRDAQELGVGFLVHGKRVYPLHVQVFGTPQEYETLVKRANNPSDV